jgi:hypothetical protein
LPDGQPRSQSPLDEPREDGPSLIKIVASEQHLFDVQAFLAPFLDLVEISAVCIERISVSSWDQSSVIAAGQLIVVPYFSQRCLYGRP